MIGNSYSKFFEVLFPFIGCLFVWFYIRGFQYFPAWNTLLTGLNMPFSTGNEIADQLFNNTFQVQWFMHNITELSALITRMASPSSLGAFGTPDALEGILFIANILSAGLPIILLGVLILLNVIGMALSVLVPFLNAIGYITAMDGSQVAVTFGAMGNVFQSSSSQWMGYPSSSSWSFTGS